MNSNIICRAYFSPHGTTKAIMEDIVSSFHGIQLICDLMKDNDHDKVKLSSQDILLAGIPVYAGRIPKICRKRLLQFQGDKTPAIIFVNYGNRDYEDALLELKDILTKQGFKVIIAAAFVSEHAIFPSVAHDRPNEEDKKRIQEFTSIAKMILANLSENYTTTLAVPGNSPYKKAGKVPLIPSVSDACTACGTCAKVCPSKAISLKHPQKTNRWKCIACTACIYVCPNHARSFQGKLYEQAKDSFENKYQAVKKPEIFM